MKSAIRWLLAAFLTASFPWAALAAVPADALVKGSSSAVYYYAADGKRYVFPNEKTYRSWFLDFSHVLTISDAELAAMPLGGNVTYRPGIRLLKVQTDPKVYAVAPGGVLRWVKSEGLAEDLYGQFWNTAVDDLPDAFFVNYAVGDPIEEVKDFTPFEVAESVDTINADKGLPVSALPRRAETEVSNIVDAWRLFALEDINRIRQENGKPPLIMNLLLNRIATIHSKDMAVNIKKLQHEGSLGENSDDRIRFGKVPDVANHVFITVPHPEGFGWSGENLGFITRRANQTVESRIARLHEAFMDEPDDEPNHRTTMLSTFHPFSEIGIGPYLDDQGDLWLTEDFISPAE